MNKNQERLERSAIVNRINAAYKNNAIKINTIKLDSIDTLNSKLALCTTQASLIDLALKNHLTVSDTASKLVETKLCKSIDAAYARIKRHKNHDEESRIVKRAFIINALEVVKAQASE